MMITSAVGGVFASRALVRRTVARGGAAAISCLALMIAPLGAQPRPDRGFERTVTVTQTKSLCFSDTLQVAGVLVPRNEVLARPDREGWQISQILVEPGDDVVSGQVLARLAPPEGQPGGGTGTAVQAPAAGIVTATSAIIGATASTQAEPLFRIAARGEMELLGETPVAKLADLAPDQAAKVTIIGIGELPGKVRLISTAVNPMTQMGQVRVFIGADQRLRVGAFGRANIETGRRCGAAIPLSAVLYGSGGALVQVVRDGRVETRTVSIGLVADGQAEVREGLTEGEMVIARAGAFVREGDRVRPVVVDDPPEHQ